MFTTGLRDSYPWLRLFSRISIPYLSKKGRIEALFFLEAETREIGAYWGSKTNQMDALSFPKEEQWGSIVIAHVFKFLFPYASS